MPSSEYINEAPYAGESQANPLQPLEHMLQWLTSTTVHLAIGFAIGLIVARVMRSRHLRWTWAATALGVVFAGRSILGGGLATTLGAAALCATVRGRRWHREDLDTGADLAEIAAQRRGPVDAARSLAQGLRDDCRDAGASPQSPWRGNRLIVGHEAKGRAVTIPVGGPSGGTHTLVLGAAGSGKTVTMTWIATQTISRSAGGAAGAGGGGGGGRGEGVIVVDPKGDRDLRQGLIDAARAAGRPYLEWSPEGPSVYNPYARGGATEIADKALAGERYTEPHYQRQAQRYLGHVVRGLRTAGVEVSLQGIVDHLDPDRLELLARQLPESDAQSTHAYLDSLTKRQRSDLAGVRDRLAIMAESDVGCWLDPQTPGAEQVELLQAVLGGAVVYFNLDADRRPLLTAMLAGAIVQDLQTTVSALQGQRVSALVAIDEFSAIAPEQVAGLYARARGAGVSMLLGTQEIADLRLPGAERLLDQMMGNLSTLIAHRQVLASSAELIASLTAKRGVWRTTHRDDGGYSRTRELENVLAPEQIMGLAQGRAAVIDLQGGGDASIADICSPRRRKHRGRRHRWC